MPPPTSVLVAAMFCLYRIYLHLQVGEWSGVLEMTNMPTVYIQPHLTKKPVFEIRSTCRGDNCPHIEWWMYDIPYLIDETKEKNGRTTLLYVNMYDTYEGDGECSGKVSISCI